MNSDNLLNPEAFWQFSCELYALPGVKELCLDAQNRLCLNVNILLLCQWLTHHGKSISVEGFIRLQEAIAESENTLLSLRQKRNSLIKASTEYKTALQNELDWEMKQQQTLIKTLAKATRVNASEHCLYSYIQSRDPSLILEAEKLKQVLEQSAV
ncbi:TIGR02444 family protein [Planctobacterium marinum]|uniref:TIGR02444 family protein n=1 Tax=Planctobacterium marinum TaxID=1631968 RepID=A0AA48HE02_9ALTE|nr:hypothetical protein MACH26_01020 [Planctobacterium marinum]